MKRKSLLVLLLSAILVLAVGCGSGGGQKEEEPVYYTITVNATGGGTATADKEKATAGETVTVTTSCPETHVLVSLTYNGRSFKNSFRMPAQEVEVIARFSERSDGTHAVIVDSSNGGKLFADPAYAVAGETVTLTAVPEPGYSLGEVTLNGEVLEGMTFEMPNSDALVYGTFVRDPVAHTVTAENSRYGKVVIDKSQAKSGEIVTADWFPLNGYVLDYFTVNGKNVGSNCEIIMPSEDAVISAVFRKAIEDTPVKLSVNMNNAAASYYWYFEYTDFGLKVTVKVIDPVVIVTGDARYRDYVECIVGLYEPFETDWKAGKTVKYTVTADGTCFYRTAVSATMFGRENFNIDGNLFRTSTKMKQLANKDGYSGYEVTMEFGYGLFGVSKEEGVGNVTVCPAMNNSESLVTGSWRNLCLWFDVSSHLRILKNGLPA